MGVPAVLVRKSTKEIIKFANYPREDMQLVEGLDPDLEWLVKRIPFQEPDYDPRMYLLVTNIPDLNLLDNFQPHPDYPHLKEYLITYSTEKRLLQDIETSIEGVEVEANSSIVPYTDLAKLAILGLGVTIRYLEGQNLTPKELAIKDKIMDSAVKLWKNDANVQALKQQLIDGLDPNIDEGWEK